MYKRKKYDYSGRKRVIATIILASYISVLTPFSMSAESLKKAENINAEFESKEKSEVLISAEKGGVVTLGEASIEIPAGALQEDTKISITKLRKVEDTGESLYNAIPKSGGYRFLPAGTKFKKDVTISLPYSSELNKKPQALDELYTYFYDTTKKNWIKLERIEVDQKENKVRSLSNHFTDMINATLTMPETASPLDINLNTIKNLEAAKPDSHLIKFNPPKASNTGDASFSFELGIPSGRHGLQPQLTVSYSSAGGNGIMGKGFDINYGSSITIDTRLGLPSYDGKEYTGDKISINSIDGEEIHVYPTKYMLDGILLYEIIESRNNNKVFYIPQKESSFSRIIRYDTEDGEYNQYTWEVTDKSGTKRIYEQNSLSCVGSGKIRESQNEKFIETFTWNLSRIVDVYKNNVIYKYNTFDEPDTETNGYVYPTAIYYTGYGEKEGNYSIKFHYDEESEKRQDVRIDARSREFIECKKLLTSITTHYNEGDCIRKYSFIYKEGLAKEKMLAVLSVSNNAGESYHYTFDYTEPVTDNNGNVEYFAEVEEWTNEGSYKLQKSHSTSVNASFNSAAGVGYGTTRKDFRITGGVSGSAGSSSSSPDNTMIDINGDGRADAITQKGNVVYVAINNGKGFNSSIPINLGDEELENAVDYENSYNSSLGWNIYGGLGVKGSALSASLGIGYSSVTQNNTSVLECSFIDIDRDGLVDIVQSGKDYYLKNLGNLNFSKKYINFEYLIEDIEDTLSLDEINEYQETYFIQNPFRMWEAPYEGQVLINETIQKLNEKNPMIVARTIIGEKDVENLRLTLEKNEGTRVSNNDKINIEDSRNFYFITDFGNEPKNTDIDWNINIEYSKIKPLKNNYTEAVLCADLVADNAYITVSSKSEVKTFEEDFKKNLPAEILYEMYNPTEVVTEPTGPNGTPIFDASIEYSDDWKNKDINTAAEIFAVLIENGYFLPGAFSRSEFEEYIKELNERDVEDKETYFKEFASHFRHNISDDLFVLNSFTDITKKKQFYENYPLSKELKQKCLAKYDKEGLQSYFLTDGITYGFNKSYTPSASILRSEQNLGIIFKKNEDYFVNIGAYEDGTTSTPIFYNISKKEIESSEREKESIKLKEVNSDDSSIKLVLTKGDEQNGHFESLITYDLKNISYKPEILSSEEFKKIYDSIEVDYSNVDDWPAEIKENELYELLTNIGLEEDEKELIIDSLYGERHEMREAVNQAGVVTYVVEYYYKLKEVPDKNIAQNILDSYKKRIVLEQEFPFYDEQEDGTYKLKEEYKDVSNSILEDICKENGYGNIGTINLNIEYDKEYSYTLNKNIKASYSMMLLNLEKEESISFYNKDITVEKYIWNSADDFSSDAKENSFSVYDYEVDEEDNLGKIEANVYVDSDEFLYGGTNNWYYGVWKSSWKYNNDEIVEDYPFSENLLKQFLSNNEIDTEDEEKANEEFLHMQEHMQKNCETLNVTNPQKSESETDVHFYLPCAQKDSSLIQNVQDLSNSDVTYYVEYDKALLGTVSVKTSFAYDEAGNKKSNSKYYMPFIQKDIIHADRAGGEAYYNIEGLYYEDPDANSGLAIPKIRKTYTKGKDTTPNISVELSTPQKGIEDLAEAVKEAAEIAEKGLSGSLSLTKGTNISNSTVKQAFQDINGDNVPDILQVQEEDKKIVGVTAYLSSVNDDLITYSDKTSLSNMSALGLSTSDVSVFGGSVSSGGNVNVNPSGLKNMTIKIEQKPTPTPSGGVTFTTGSNTQKSGLADINGDGLCDYFDDGVYKLNNGSDFITREQENFQNDNISEGNNSSIGINFSLGIGTTKDLFQAKSLKSGGSINIGVSYSSSDSTTKKMMMDINGDGLQDILEMTPGDSVIKVKYNTGNSFTEESFINIPKWGNIVTSNESNFLKISDGIGNNLEFAKDTPLVGQTVVDGIKDININPNAFLDGNKTDALDLNTSITLGFSTGIGLNLNLPHPIGIFGVINTTFTASTGISISYTANGTTVRMIDLDGDALPDHVLYVPELGIYWKRNISGRYGQLTGINTPQGGKIEIEYSEKYGTVNNPNFKYVMSRVTINDGADGLGLLPDINQGEHSITTLYEYENAYYDRAAKEFYGFERVITKNNSSTDETENPVYTSQVDTYFIDYYYRKGLLYNSKTYGSAEYNETGKLLSVTNIELSDAPYAITGKEENWVYEASTGESNYIYTSTEYKYDLYGNCKELCQDFGDGKKISCVITYQYNKSKYIMTMPDSIMVYNSFPESGDLIRYREGSYNDYGQLEELKTYYNSNQYSINKLTYDNYGNIISVTDSHNAKITYEYDDNLHMFVEKISQYGEGADTYESLIEYDPSLQLKLKERDCNGNSLIYKYDSWQRISKIWTAYDIPEDLSARYEDYIPAISYEYYTPQELEIKKDGSSIIKEISILPHDLWYNITSNKVTFDSALVADGCSVINTLVQIDGIGRAVRTAKTGYVEGINGWNVSGSVEYDKKGRTVKEGMTEFIKGDLENLLNTTPIMAELFTSYKYDDKDRQIRTILPDGSIQTTSFEIINGNAVSSSKDPLGNVSVQETDSHGNIVRVAKKDSYGKLLTEVTYEYNIMGEMLKAFDAKGHPVTVEYDLMGRKTALESADSGRQEFFYDDCSNLIRENNSVLRENNKQILYEYDGLNRLIKIDYPDTSDTVYTYGAANDKDGAAGRILSVTDASGSLVYKYGKLGEVTKETRSLTSYLNNTEIIESVMEYRSDYLGRMQRILYPDGEEITYGYDPGGQVISVKGRHFEKDFIYVSNILYDKYGQRTHIDYGNGTFTEYNYDPARRWLDTIKTRKANGPYYQNIKYSFDAVGNVLGYENNCLDSAEGNYKTSQTYTYDSLYQLIKVNGETSYNPYKSSVPEFVSSYSQNFTFDTGGLGNMIGKSSTETVTPQKTIGDNLNYSFDYVYDETYAHRLVNAGERYYKYDGNGNVICEQDGSFDSGDADVSYHKITKEADDVYSTDYGWGLFRDDSESSSKSATRFKRTYIWDERNQLVSSVDANYSTAYVYGHDGQRTNKYTSSSETLYFNKMWTRHTDSGNRVYGGQTAKNIYLGETRIVTKLNSGANPTYQEEYYKRYYYHSDHLGSASLISDYKGDEYQRIEYTPYGETWVEKTQNTGLEYLPYKFTAKEMDEETGLYYYGARYLDPKYSRWLSTDPALADYIPQAPVSDEARKHNQNLPGMGGLFNHINGNLYAYAANNPVNYTDPDGQEVTFTIYRDVDSRGSYKDSSLRQRDKIVFTNEDTGESFTLINCQTVVSNFKDGKPKTSSGNTLCSNQKFTIQLLNPKASKFKGPVFNIQNTDTEGLGIIDENGIDILDKTDKRPFRIHSNALKNSTKTVPMASDGCPMYSSEQISEFEKFLEDSNVKSGDILKGIIKEDIIYGP